MMFNEAEEEKIAKAIKKIKRNNEISTRGLTPNMIVRIMGPFLREGANIRANKKRIWI